MRRICVYCGSNHGRREIYAEAATALGQELARRGLGLVYGGGGVGLMGVLADAVLDAGGEVVGVIPAALDAREVSHPRVQDLRLVSSMHERKALMAELSEGFLALPGGLGTFEELFESWTWSQLGIHRKPCGLLDVAGYYQPLLAALDLAVAEGFVRREHRDMLIVEHSPAALLDRFEAYDPPTAEKWLSADEI
jgi:hypothetical protein